MCLASRCQATGEMSDIEASGSLGDGLKVLGGAFRHSLEWSRSIALLIIRPSACIYLGFNLRFICSSVFTSDLFSTLELKKIRGPAGCKVIDNGFKVLCNSFASTYV